MWSLSEAWIGGSLAAVGSFVRRVKTASGATAVQIVHKRGRVVRRDRSRRFRARRRPARAAAAEPRGNACTPASRSLEFGPGTAAGAAGCRDARWSRRPRSLILWDALQRVYEALGFTAVARRGVPGAGAGADHRADQQARHRPRAERARGRLPVAGDVHALPQTHRRAGLPRHRSRRPATATPPAPAGWRWCSTT